MTRYSIVVNKKGTILSFNVVDADPARFPVVRDLKGSHFSRLIGVDCKKYLRHVILTAAKTGKPTSFHTFFVPKGRNEGPVVEWTVQQKPSNLFKALSPARYLLLGTEEEQ